MFDQQKYKNQWMKDNYKDVKFRIHKEKAHILKDLSAIHHKSVNRLITEAIEKQYDVDLTIVESKLKQP